MFVYYPFLLELCWAIAQCDTPENQTLVRHWATYYSHTACKISLYTVKLEKVITFFSQIFAMRGDATSYSPNKFCGGEYVTKGLVVDGRESFLGF